MRRAELPMQEAEDDRKLGIFTHSISNAHTCVQAGERSTDQRDNNGSRYNRGEGNTIAAEDLVTYNLRHIAYWRTRIKGSREASSRTVLVPIVDKEIRGKVLQEVEDDRLNDER